MEKTHSLQDLFEALRQQQKIIRNLSGMAAVQTALSPVREMQDQISGSLRLYRENPVVQVTKRLRTFDRNLFKGIPTIPDPTAPMREYLSAINRANRLWQEQFAAIAASTRRLDLALNNALPRMDTRQQAALGIFNAALCGTSATFLKNSSYTQTRQEAAIVGTTNSIVAETLDDVYGSQNTTAEDTALDRFREALLTELSKLLTRTTCRRVREFLLELISITSAILAIYSAFTAPGKEDIADIVRAELRSAPENQEQEIHAIAGRYLAKKRTALFDAPLRYAAAKNARIIGTVKRGQTVTVVETRHKYLLVVYIDTQTQEPKSGFVLKKYFLRQNKKPHSNERRLKSDE